MADVRWTVSGALAAIRAAGLTATFTSHGAREYRVDYKPSDPRYIRGEMGTAYFTPDAEDAVATAHAMAAMPAVKQ